MYWQMTAPPTRAQARPHPLRRRLLRHNHKQALLKHRNQPIKVIHTHATTAATIVVTTAVTVDLSEAVAPASAVPGTREADGASATMTAGVQVQASDHGVTGIEDIMIGDRATLNHGTGVAAADSVSAAMTARVGIQIQATVLATALAVGRDTDHGMTGAEAIMTGGQNSVDPGMTATEAEWASAGNRLYRKKPCIAGLFLGADKRGRPPLIY